MSTAPVLFVSHGAPTFAVEPGLLGPLLRDFGRSLDARTRAILIVSAHWQSHGIKVMATPQPETMHDFGGFPPELYRIVYPATGSPLFAEKARQLLLAAGFRSGIDTMRGLDHGAWVPLRYLQSDGRLPVFQVSLPEDLDAQQALRMGNAMAPLRDDGVLIVGSGSLTHNLHEVFRGTADIGYAQQFVAWTRDVLERRDLNQLAQYRRQAPDAARAHPTAEHFLPLAVAVGATTAADTLSILDGGMSHGVLSMESYVWRHSN